MLRGTNQTGATAFACILGLALGAGCIRGSAHDVESTNTLEGSGPAGSSTVNPSGAGEASDSDGAAGAVAVLDGVDASALTDASAPTDVSGPTEEGVQDPNVDIQGSPEYSQGLVARDSTLSTDADGDFRWLFTIENTTDAPVCSEHLELKLYDHDGTLLAGNGPDKIIPEDGLPIFLAEMTGSPYRMGYLVTSCIAPGERGVGRGGMLSLTGGPLDVEGLLEKAGRIEYFFARRIQSENYVPASDLLVVTDATLIQTDEGAVVSGTASNGAALLEWTIHAALYDASGKLIDYVSTTGSQWPDGEDVTFELPAASANATSFELYTDFTIWQ